MTRGKYVKIITGFLILFGFLLITTPTSTEAVVRRRITRTKTTGGTKAAGGSTIGVYPRLRGDRLGLNISFSNLNSAESVTYVLTYNTNGKGEGVQGGVGMQEGNSVSRQLLFGTCSHGVCTYHRNITNARFEVRAKLKNGKTLLRRYRIKV